MRIHLYSNDPDLPICHYYIEDDTCERDALDEALYVLWELTPTKTLTEEWYNLVRDGSCQFDYHGCEFTTVERISAWEYLITHRGEA